MFAKMRPFFGLTSARPLYSKRSERITRAKLFFDVIAQDAQVYCGGERPGILFYILSLLGFNAFSAVLFYRLDSALYDKGLPWSVLAKLMRRWNQVLNACEIFPQAKIGPGLYVPYPIGVGAGPITAGRNLTILPHSILTIRDRSRQLIIERYPSFGDNVTIGPSAVVLGPVVIGDNVVIGAGAIVHKDVPTGCRAVGNPARVITPEIVAACHAPSTPAQKS